MTTLTGQASPGSPCPPHYRPHPPASRQDTLRHPQQHTEHHFQGALNQLKLSALLLYIFHL